MQWLLHWIDTKRTQLGFSLKQSYSAEVDLIFQMEAAWGADLAVGSLLSFPHTLILKPLNF